MNSDSLILRQTDHPPLTNKADYINATEFDSNLTKIYDDLVALCVSLGVEAYDSGTTYDDTTIQYATYNSRLYRYIFATPESGHSPADVDADDYWIEVFPTILAHRKNQDTKLDEGGTNEVTAAQLKASLNGGYSGAKLFKAQIIQSGTSAPTINIIKNDFGGTITPLYNGVGQYSLVGFANQLTGYIEISVNEAALGNNNKAVVGLPTDSAITIGSTASGTYANTLYNVLTYVTIVKYP